MNASAAPRAFSLIEVLLAIGIGTLAVVAILALLPVGIKSSHTSIEESEALNVLSEIVADRRASPLASASSFYGLPALTTNMSPVSASFGVREDHHPAASAQQARWRVSYTFSPPAPGSLGPWVAHFRIGWPYASTNTPEAVENVVTFPQP
ncbi:MAG TPA: hypothetical protein VIM58_04470 [Candidatus Methylacidiphilales bacterium]